jgi:hypothetical protein
MNRAFVLNISLTSSTRLKAGIPAVTRAAL